MMSRPLDESYLEWLYNQVVDTHRRSALSYWTLFRVLYQKEFVWLILNDDNRVNDGLDYRRDFITDRDISDSDDWVSLGCSFLEVLFGLSRRLEFETDISLRDWFWHLIEVLGLREYHDKTLFPDQDVNDILDTVIWRTYLPNGHGGLFPLEHARKDQRNVELWYQLNAYLIENDY